MGVYYHFKIVRFDLQKSCMPMTSYMNNISLLMSQPFRTNNSNM